MRLKEMAATVRSKNAGPDLVTFDILFTSDEDYRRAKASPSLSRTAIAACFGIPEERVVAHVAFDPARALKFTIRRRRPSGSPGESDLFGAQQYGPLLDLEVQEPVESRQTVGSRDQQGP